MKRYQKIDLLRLFCAALVVLIHTLEIREGHPIAQMLVICFAGQAVPFFFITSGFFFAKKLETAREPIDVVRKQVTHNLLLYGAWMVVEFPGLIATYHKLYPDASAFLYLALIIRRIFLAGQGVYWFILVLAEALLISGLLLTHKKEKLLYGLAAIGLLLEFIYKMDISVLGLGYLNKLFYMVFSWNNNVIMAGLPYVTIGILIAKHEERLRISLRTLLASYGLVAAASIAAFVLCYTSRPDLLRRISPGSIQSVLLFLIALHPSERRYSRKLCANCRDLSTCLYYLHTVFIYYVADPIIGLHAPVLIRYAFGFLLPVLVWLIVRKLDWKPAKWMLSMK